MKINKLLVLVAGVAMLAGCGDVTSSGALPTDTPTYNPTDVPTVSPTETPTDVPTETPTEAPTESPTEAPTTPVEEKYSVKVVNPAAGISLSVDKAKAVPGEIITVTVTILDPAYKVSKVLVDSRAINKIDDTTYQFKMPDHPVKVTCELIVEGDVTIAGEISAAFKKEGDIYVARGVKVSKDSNFDILVKSKDGITSKMSVQEVDRFKTFANIGFSNDRNYALTIAGRATYDFYYDVKNGDKPVYVKRVSVDQLPTNVNSLYDLFEGRIRSSSSVFPENLASMTYKNAKANEQITWNAYNDNSSYAVVSEKDVEGNLNEKAFVYAELNNNELTVVDTYTPGNNKAFASNNVLCSDLDVFSGEYIVSDKDEYGEMTDNNDFAYYDHYIDPTVAEHMVNVSPINLEAFESDIMPGYRVGYIVEGSVTEANSTITSVPTETGFTTTVKSSRTIDTTSDRSSSSLAPEQTHNEYRIDLKFTKSGALLDGVYSHRTFGADKYNFKTNTWYNGDADSNFDKGLLINKISVSYTYGEKSTNEKTLDLSPYFVNEIKNITIDNKDCVSELPNKLNIGDRLNEYVKFDVLPNTALNAHQYGIIDSSNKDTVSHETYIGYIAKNPGVSNITIGNINGRGVSGSVEVNIVEGQLVRSFYMNARYGKFQEITTSDTAKVYTGQLNEFGLDCKSGKNKSMPIPKNVTLEIVGDSKGFTASINHENQSIVLNGLNATFTETTSFDVVINTPSYDPDWSRSTPSVLTFTIYKGTDANAILGNWVCPVIEGAKITFTDIAVDDERYPLLGTVICEEGKIDFHYYWNAQRNEIKTKIVTPGYDLSDLTFVYHAETQKLDVFFVVRSWTTEDGQKTKEVFGWEDGENMAYDVFVKEA